MFKIRNLFLCFIIFCLFSAETPSINAAKNAALHNTRGLDNLKNHYYYEAGEEFKLAISLCPGTPATAVYYNNLGETCLKVNLNNSAIFCFEQAIKLNPTFLVYYQNLIRAYKGKKIFSAAKKKYTALTKKTPHDSSNWLILALINKEEKNTLQALNCFQKYKDLEPNLSMTKEVDAIMFEMKADYEKGKI